VLGECPNPANFVERAAMPDFNTITRAVPIGSLGEALHRGALRRLSAGLLNHRRASSSRVNRRHKERRYSRGAILSCGSSNVPA